MSSVVGFEEVGEGFKLVEDSVIDGSLPLRFDCSSDDL